MADVRSDAGGHIVYYTHDSGGVRDDIRDRYIRCYTKVNGHTLTMNFIQTYTYKLENFLLALGNSIHSFSRYGNSFYNFYYVVTLKPLCKGFKETSRIHRVSSRP